MEKRLKILLFLALSIKAPEKFLDNLEELAQKIDAKHPQAEEALNYYEDKLIKIFENEF